MRTFLVGAGAAVALALIAGCASTDDNATTPSTTATQAGHNAEDIAFAQGMIPHHAQAVEMAKMVPSRGTSKQVLDLAGRIQQAQDPEIRQLTGMLTQWGAPTSSMPGMNHGTMPSGDMASLEQATGAGFDRMWTDMMIKHHEGAIDMARTELDKGTNPDAKAMAQKIIDVQQAEITQMQNLK
jgi:uncharacterized protein (DUF305 family)